MALKINLILIPFALLSASPAQARNIVMVANVTTDAENYGSVLLDLDITSSAGDKRAFRSYIFSRSGAEFVRGANDTEADCAKGTVRYVKRRLYSDTHELIGELDEATRWSKAGKNSPEAKMVRLACGIEKPGEADLLGDVDPLAISDPLLNDPKFR